MPSPTELWRSYSEGLLSAARVSLDVSRMAFPAGFLEKMDGPARRALTLMRDLEGGAIANPDENRRVGHYWLRAPELAPERDLRDAIVQTFEQARAFAAAVHSGKVAPPGGGRFTNLLVIGIGGSALGPQLVAGALGTTKDPLFPFFFDNPDPDGFDRTLASIGARGGGLAETMVVVISKSGGTKETRNGMLEAREAFDRSGLDFARHAVAITGAGSELDGVARAEGWIDTFPMWDWVGGRTSVLGPVGCVPALLQGIDAEALIGGARDMDRATREETPGRNMAVVLALAWHHATGGRGEKDMVVLPYKDSLSLFSRYLQQLVMESLGKERDLEGNVVNQGIAVYGNKGSTDQHSYVQQLRDGVHNFFVTFIEVLTDRDGESIEVEPGVTSGDYLLGFLLGTREALRGKGRQSLTLTIDAVTPAALGALIALHERAVGIYACLVNINAYHQPGVQAGKEAAERVIELQEMALLELERSSGEPRTAEEIARAAGAPDEVEVIHKVLEHLARNGRGVSRHPGTGPAEHRYGLG
ncbi:MAG TPA: glucose-6-phosphate isomerase [Planctomycetota bacterium]|nr:glucose-6-phosphate isomerase [Planctomycetota bacterium]